VKTLSIKRSFLWPITLLTLVLATIVIGFAVARMPQNTNALQIRPVRAGVSLPDGFYVYQSLNQRGIRIQSITPVEDGLVVELDSREQREMAEHVLQDILPLGFSVQRCDPPPSQLWVHKITRDQLKLG
jgi:hypothetical protein